MNTETPASLGYRWPAEWEPHLATWLSWPRNRDTWPGVFDRALSQYHGMVELIARHEPVFILAGGADTYRSAHTHVGHLDNVTLLDIQTNDAWIRDHGPIFLQASSDQKQSLLDFQYNAWGGKYPPFDLDNAVPEKVAQQLAMHRFASSWILEGGSIDGDGQGTLLTTENCLLAANRNPGQTIGSIEQHLREYLGITHVVWLSGELDGDDTDGHIDQLVRFISPECIVMLELPATSILRDNERKLQQWAEAVGRDLHIRRLPMPGCCHFEGQPLPASYANFYLCNDAILVPVFGDPSDQRACEILAEADSTRTVLPVPSDALVAGLGAVHCLTQQQCMPRAKRG